MKDKSALFRKTIEEGYSFKGDSIKLGVPIYEGEIVADLSISIPLKTFNRHGLIAGATGTGKTKTLQALAEGLSESGVPVLMMDIKGDLSGLAMKGASNEKVIERAQKTGVDFTPKNFPTELLSISEEKGVRLRSTVIEFGPVLFSKVLGLNDTQSGLVSLIFKFCDDNRLPLLDLKDFKKVLQYISEEGKSKIEKEYGNISTTSSSTILRKVIDLEQQGANLFFGEKSFEIDDLIRTDKNGLGYISILKLTDLQDRPKLFSTFMLSLLAEIYAQFPEAGDMDKPKLVIFMDEAHLIFEEASQALNDQLEAIIKLIRSKGVGIFFCTQNPSDIPSDILGQLGLKIQHALRAFTAKDRKTIKMTAENYPLTDFYQTDELLTSLGIGEALVTALNEKGIPTPLAATMLRPPLSRMDILSPSEINDLISQSKLVDKYNEEIDRESAFELLSKKLSQNEDEDVEDEDEDDKALNEKKGKSTFEEIMESSVTKQIGRTLARELTRGLLGVLGIKSSSTRRRSGGGLFS